MPNPFRGSRYGSVDGSDYVMSAVACSGFLTFLFLYFDVILV